MARFETDGLQELVDKVVELGNGTEKLQDRMLLAGAEVVKRGMKDAAEKHGFRDTGDLIESIDYKRKPQTLKGARYLDIFPQGKHRPKPKKRGGGDFGPVRNAEIGFVLNYGTSKIPASHWLDDAETMAGPKAVEAMEEIYDEHLKEKELI